MKKKPSATPSLSAKKSLSPWSDAKSKYTYGHESIYPVKPSNLNISYFASLKRPDECMSPKAEISVMHHSLFAIRSLFRTRALQILLSSNTRMHARSVVRVMTDQGERVFSDLRKLPQAIGLGP